MVPWAVFTDYDTLLDVLPQPGILDRINLFLWVDVQMHTLHDLAESCTEVVRKVSVFHASTTRDRIQICSLHDTHAHSHMHTHAHPPTDVSTIPRS